MKYLLLENAYEAGRRVAVLRESVLCLKELKDATCITTKQGQNLWAKEHINHILAMLED